MKELKEAGYKVDHEDKKKIFYHVKDRNRQEKCAGVKWEIEV